MQISVEQAMQLAIQSHQAGKMAEAIQLYRQVLAERPNYGDALHLLGTVYAQLGNYDAAIELIGKAVAENPKIGVYRSNLGNAYRDMGKPKEALDAYREVLRLDPESAKDYANFAAALREGGNPDGAIKACNRAIKLNDKLPELHHELGLALLEKGKLDAAITSFRRTISLAPEWPSAHWNLSVALLQKGNYQQGWVEHEWRLKMKEFAGSANPGDKPKWTGEKLAGRTVLVTPEQGHGDVIQFMRYVPLIEHRGGHVVIQSHPALHRLLEGVPGLKQLDAITPESYDLHCPLLSLPLAHDTRLGSIPVDLPYLLPDADLVEALGSKIDYSNGKLKVGVAWVSPPTYPKNDKTRSISLAQLAPLNAIEGVEYFNVQSQQTPLPVEETIAELKLLDPPSELMDFADIAALISYMDIVICVDSAVAHLAGAMGKNAWLLLSTRPDWRWLPDKEENPWYPTMRVFRQKAAGDWAEVVGRVVQALGEVVNAKHEEK